MFNKINRKTDHCWFLLFFWLLFGQQFGFTSCAGSQAHGLKIEVKSVDCLSDSLVLQRFDGKHFVDFLSVRCRPNAIFRQSQPIPPGLYLLTVDSTIEVELLISDTVHQQFSITIQEENIVFEHSDENSANFAYQKELQRVNYKMQMLERQFFEIRSSTMDEAVKNSIMDSLQSQAKAEMRQLEQRQQQILQQFPDALITALIHATSDIPIPQKYYQDQILVMQYQMEHYFDNYPFEDERLLNTPVAFDKFRQYAAMISQVGDLLPDSVVTRILNQAQVSAKSYNALFETWQKIIGDISSPFWTESVYIEMLHHALASYAVDSLQKQYYQTQLRRFDKNRKGSVIPDFAVMLPNGTKTDIYSIESEYILLYFHNPDCPTCVEIREKLLQMAPLHRAIDQQKIKVVTVFFEKDRAIWQKYLKEQTHTAFINTWNYDNAIESEELFDLSVIPFMFLLDKEKRVIVKDISVEALEAFLPEI